MVVVVRMARQPEVFVNQLEPEQAQRLVRLTRRSPDRVRLRRAGDCAGVGAGAQRGADRGDVRRVGRLRAGGDPRVQRQASPAADPAKTAPCAGPAQHPDPARPSTTVWDAATQPRPRLTTTDETNARTRFAA